MFHIEIFSIGNTSSIRTLHFSSWKRVLRFFRLLRKTQGFISCIIEKSNKTIGYSDFFNGKLQKAQLYL